MRWMLALCLLLTQNLTLEPELYRPLAAQVIRVRVGEGRIAGGRLLAGWREIPFEDLRFEGGGQVADVMAPRDASSFVLVAEAGTSFAKALGYVGAPAPGFDRVVGHPLELVPLANPYTLRAGDVLPVRVLWRGRALAGARVSVLRSGRVVAVESADGGGVARLRVTGPGVWRLDVEQQKQKATLSFEFEEDRP